MTHKLVDEVRSGTAPLPASSTAALSPREREIVRCIATGASNKEIAGALGVAESMVKIHVQHILRKLDLSSRVQVALYTSERGYAARSATR